MLLKTAPKTRQYKPFVSANVENIPQIKALKKSQKLALKSVAAVLPFKVNNYVVEDLIDWDNIPADPIFQLSFPHEKMLEPGDFRKIYNLIKTDVDRKVLLAAVDAIRFKMNPHPGGQMDLNVPYLEGIPQEGMQHKYRETILFFPSQGQTCHTYCTYCFRWAQFVGMESLRFANNEVGSLVRYLRKHPEITDVLITGGDPLVMRTSILSQYVEPLLAVPTLKTIRIGTKSVAWWPYRFVTDHDAEDLLRLFESVVESGKHMALMAHYSHPIELSTPVAQQAVRNITQTGAVVRCQAPLIHRVNDKASVWSELWQKQVSLGAIPYYMFVERDTGPKNYFGVPLYKASKIFNEAYRSVSGLARTVRGPSMSSTPGKVHIDGVAEINRKKVFVLKFIQGRNPDWSGKVFFAKYDEKAVWLDDLKPIVGKKFFFEDELKQIKTGKHPPLWKGQEGKKTHSLKLFSKTSAMLKSALNGHSNGSSQF